MGENILVTQQEFQQLRELSNGSYPDAGDSKSGLREHIQSKALIMIAERMHGIEKLFGELLAESKNAVDILQGIEQLLAEGSGSGVESGPAVSAQITIGGNMPGAITVDTTNETVALTFYDDKQNSTSAPDGATVTFTSDNEAAATVAADPNNPLQGDITPVAPGAANIGANITDANGQPLMEPDGTTPFSVAPVAVTVSAGPAESAGLILSA